MAELNQLEGIQHLENQLNKMGSVRDVALANQNAEKMAQKIRVSHKSRKIYHDMRDIRILCIFSVTEGQAGF